MKELNDFDKKRLQYNIKVNNLINKTIRAYPQIRITQLMTILNIGNGTFNEEPWETYKRIKPTCEQIIKTFTQQNG